MAEGTAENLLRLTDADFDAWRQTHQRRFDATLIQACKAEAERLADGDGLDGALRLLDRAALLAEAMEDPLAMALVWRGRANVLQHHERYADSLEAAHQAVALYAQHGNEFDLAVARTVEVAVLGALERYDEAVDLGHWIRPHFQQAGFLFGQARLAHALAYVYTLAWRLDEAMAEYQIAQRLFTELDQPLDSAWVLLNMGVLANQMDRLEQARDLYTRAYPVFVAHDDVVMMVKTQFNLAQNAVRQANYEDALAHLAQARRHLQRLPASPDTGYVDLHEAQVRQRLHQPQQAETLLRQAVACFQALGRRSETAEALLDLGHLLASSNTPEKLAEGLACLEQAEDHLQAVGIPLFVAWSQLEQAEALLRLRRADEAYNRAALTRQYFAQAGLSLRQAQAEIVMADGCRRLEPAQARRLYEQALVALNAGPPLLAARCWQGLGWLASHEGNSPAAERAYAQAFALLDGLRRGLHGHAHQAGFLEDKQAAADGLLAALHSQPDRAATLFAWLERFKASALADLLANEPPDESMDATLADLWKQREALARRIDEAEDASQTLQVGALSLGGNAALAATLQGAHTQVAHDRVQAGEMAGLRRRLQALDEEIARRRTPVNLWRRGASMEAQNAHTLLDDETLLISYYAINGKLYALTATRLPGDLHIHPLPAALAEVEQQWQQSRRLLLRAEERAAPLQQRLGQLHQALIHPLSQRVDGKRRLLILPHRGLGTIPFAGLYDPQTGRYLAESHELQFAPNATVLAWRRGRARGMRPALLVGYPGEATQADYLPGVRAEIEQLAGVLPGAAVLFGAEATAERVLAEAPGRRLVHLAGHAAFDADEPLASGLPLAGGRWLRAADLYLRWGQWNGATVVLSGCETGRGRSSGGDVLGLTSAFLYAGATAVVAGLWRVNDAATARLMGVFYEQWATGADPAGALQQAQQALLHSTEYAHPYFWAPFCLTGAS